MHLTDDVLDQWELIISEVDKENVPLECIKKMVLKLRGGKQRTINIHSLSKQGLGFEEISHIVTKSMSELEPVDIDFVVDIRSVVALVQPETDKILKKFK
jgi:hypothetical protein